MIQPTCTRRLPVALAALALGLVAACGHPQVPDACPCAPGWSCCPDAKVCVAPGVECPTAAPEPDASTPDASTPATPATSLTLLAGRLGGSGNADGVAAEARFDGAVALVSDGKGCVYVADAAAHLIRKVDVATRETTTLAGSAYVKGCTDGVGAAAQLTVPSALALDGHGTLFFSDWCGIRSLELATRKVTTLAPLSMSAQAPFNSASALAVADGTLYFSDFEWNRIGRLDLATGAIGVLAGDGQGLLDGVGTAAKFYRPYGLALDGKGTLYVADSANGRVRAVSLATGAVTTLTVPIDYPVHVAYLGGWLWLTDYEQRAWGIEVDEASAGELDPVGLQSPAFDHTVDVSGNVFIASGRSIAELDNTVFFDGAAHVGELRLAGSDPDLIPEDGLGGAANFVGLQQMELVGGQLMAVDRAGLHGVTLPDGDVTPSPPLSGGNVFGLIGADPLGHLYFWATQNDQFLVLRVYDVTSRAFGTEISLFGLEGTPTAYNAHAIADTATMGQKLYISDFDGNTQTTVVGEIDVTAVASTAVSVAFSGLAGRVMLAPDGAGHLMLSNATLNTVEQLDLATGAVVTLAGEPSVAGSNDGVGALAHFDRPGSIVADAAGQVFVIDTGNATVRRVRVATGEVSTLVGVPGQLGVKLGPLPAGLNRPTQLQLAPNGDLLIEDSGENVILCVKGASVPHSAP